MLRGGGMFNDGTYVFYFILFEPEMLLCFVY